MSDLNVTMIPQPYMGHDPVHAGLQKHSVGNAYPLTIVGYGNGDITTYVIENIVDGTVAGVQWAGHKNVRQWRTVDDAARFLDVIMLRKPVLEPVIWVPGRPVFDGTMLVPTTTH